MTRAFMASMVLVAGSWSAAGAAGETGKKGAPPVASHADAIRAVHKQVKDLQAKCTADPKAWEPRLELAEAYLRYGLTSRAVGPVNEAIAIKPDHLAAYHLAGTVHFELKQYDQAIARWNQALKLGPDDKRPRDWIVRAQMRRQSDASLKALDAKLKAAPTDAKTLLQRARLRSQRGEWKEALADAELVLSLDSANAPALAQAATAQEGLGRLDRAIPLWRRAVAADAANKQYRGRLDQAVRVQKGRIELKRLEMQLRTRPGDGKLRHRMGDLCFKLGDLPAATRHLKVAVQLLPKDPAPRKSYAIVLFRLGKMDEALKELQTCQELDPKDPSYAKLMATVRRVRDMHKALKEGGPTTAPSTPGGGAKE